MMRGNANLSRARMQASGLLFLLVSFYLASSASLWAAPVRADSAPAGQANRLAQLSFNDSACVSTAKRVLQLESKTGRRPVPLASQAIAVGPGRLLVQNCW